MGLCSSEQFSDYKNGIVQWWLIISSLHDSCYLHYFCDDRSLCLSNSLFHILFCLHWLLHSVHILLSISPLSIMSLLHIICQLFYYWAQPIVNDMMHLFLYQSLFTFFLNYLFCHFVKITATYPKLESEIFICLQFSSSQWLAANLIQVVRLQDLIKETSSYLKNWSPLVSFNFSSWIYFATEFMLMFSHTNWSKSGFFI